ncbi:MAG: hypothetical protein HYY51_00595 [Candidatus Magasanikbacteria bacterium]|nr:hypothetical protein [Candidatus Magasanikbacteria bacterium]
MAGPAKKKVEGMTGPEFIGFLMTLPGMYYAWRTGWRFAEDRWPLPRLMDWVNDDALSLSWTWVSHFLCAFVLTLAAMYTIVGIIKMLSKLSSKASS